MSTDHTDIKKYIFDPQNPKQCKSYNLLLKIAKKDPLTFFHLLFYDIFWVKSY